MKTFLLLLLSIAFVDCATSSTSLNVNDVKKDEGVFVGNIKVIVDGDDLTTHCYIGFNSDHKPYISLDSSGLVIGKAKAGTTGLTFVTCVDIGLVTKTHSCTWNGLDFLNAGNGKQTYFGNIRINWSPSGKGLKTTQAPAGGLPSDTVTSVVNYCGKQEITISNEIEPSKNAYAKLDPTHLNFQTNLIKSPGNPVIQCKSIPALLGVYLKYHYSMKELTPAIRERTANLFLQLIDPDKGLLYKKDIDPIKERILKVFETAKDGNCSSLDEVSTIITSRAGENLKIIKESLGSGFKLDETSKYQTDVTKKDFPVDEITRVKLVSALAQFSVAGSLSNLKELGVAKKNAIEMYESVLKDAEALKQPKMITMFAKSFASALDPHSEYYTMNRMDGVLWAKTWALQLAAYSKDNLNVSALKNTSLVTYRELKNNGRSFNIGVIELPAFNEEKNGAGAYQDMKRILEEANSKNVDGIILDLSRNTGGILKVATHVAGLFLGHTAVLTTVNRDSKRSVMSNSEKLTFNKPLIILTSKYTASGAEMFTGAMKDYQRALIVGGDHTNGNGSIQVLNPLPVGLGAMMLTTEMTFLPSGRSPQIVGVVPDIVIPTLVDGRKIGEQYLDSALPGSKIEPFIPLDSAMKTWKPLTESQISILKEKSLARIKINQGFKDIQAFTSDHDGKQGWVTVSEVLHPNKKYSDILDKSKNTSIDEALNIMQDWLSN